MAEMAENKQQDQDVKNAGKVYTVATDGPDITDFDPAVDRLDFGENSVHAMIMTETTEGETAIFNPWNAGSQIIKGISMKDLPIEALGVVQNEHMREDVGGALSWEQGKGPRDEDTTYILSHQMDKTTEITDFNPATDKISFLYYGSRENVSVQQDGGDLVIANTATGQSFVFKGVELASMKRSQLEFHHDQIMEDGLASNFGLTSADVTMVSREGLLTPDGGGRSTDGHQTQEGSDELIGTGTLGADADDFRFSAAASPQEDPAADDLRMRVAEAGAQEDPALASDVQEAEGNWADWLQDRGSDLDF